MSNWIVDFLKKLFYSDCERLGCNQWVNTVECDEEKLLYEKKMVIINTYRVCIKCGKKEWGS